MLFAIAIVISLSTSLVMIAIAIGKPTISIFCVSMLAFIILLVLVVPPLINTIVTAKKAMNSLNKLKTT